MPTSIQLQPATKARLDELKDHPRETYDDVVNRLIQCAIDDEPLSEETLADMAETLDDLKKGKTYSHEQVKRELGIQ
jgi:predicted transcriptional regulator